MISSHVLTAAWLLNRDWPLSLVKSGKAALICLEAIKGLSVEEFVQVREMLGRDVFEVIK